LKYNSSNAQLSQLPAGANQVVFMGDSITEEMDFSFYFSNKPYVNRGISGQITPKMLVRFCFDVINLQPSFVVILAGINDLVHLAVDEPVDVIVGNIKSMTELAVVHNIQVILASILPVCGDVAKERSPSKILEINALLSDYALQTGILYLDYFSAMFASDGSLKKELTNDCLHMNEAGYLIMAPLAEAAIQKALQSEILFQ
jgi:acyl-CoA thioesterase-1